MGGLFDTYGQPAGFGQEVVDQLQTESIAEYIIGVLIVALRTYARVRKLGFRGLQIDDYLMFVALAWYTLLFVFDNAIPKSAGSALPIPGEDLNLLTPDVIIARQNGAKITFINEEAMVHTIWTLKVCLLLMYSRLTIGARNHMLVKALAVYVAIGYVAIQLSLFLQCRPFHTYWQINPAPSLNCMVYWTYIGVQFAFNVSSDIAMLFIPLPMVIGVKVPAKQKIILLCLFSLGLFVIAAALVTKIEYYISIYDINFVYWYFREASVAMYVANLPMIWPLLRETIPGLRTFLGYTSYGRTGKTGTVQEMGNTLGTRRGGGNTTIRGGADDDDSLEFARYGKDLASAAIKEDSEKGEGGIRAQYTIEMSVERAEDNESIV